MIVTDIEPLIFYVDWYIRTERSCVMYADLSKMWHGFFMQKRDLANAGVIFFISEILLTAHFFATMFLSHSMC